MSILSRLHLFSTPLIVSARICVLYLFNLLSRFSTASLFDRLPLSILCILHLFLSTFRTGVGSSTASGGVLSLVDLLSAISLSSLLAGSLSTSTGRAVMDGMSVSSPFSTSVGAGGVSISSTISLASGSSTLSLARSSAKRAVAGRVSISSTLSVVRAALREISFSSPSSVCSIAAGSSVTLASSCGIASSTCRASSSTSSVAHIETGLASAAVSSGITSSCIFSATSFRQLTGVSTSSLAEPPTISSRNLSKEDTSAVAFSPWTSCVRLTGEVTSSSTVEIAKSTGCSAGLSARRGETSPSCSISGMLL
uniref:Uncharacterized protein n=1 Tax=Photinus pyralis TaxID=7054 RepID=A0A1Y1MH26_PHOPY